MTGIVARRIVLVRRRRGDRAEGRPTRDDRPGFARRRPLRPDPARSTVRGRRPGRGAGSRRSPGRSGRERAGAAPANLATLANGLVGRRGDRLRPRGQPAVGDAAHRLGDRVRRAGRIPVPTQRPPRRAPSAAPPIRSPTRSRSGSRRRPSSSSTRRTHSRWIAVRPGRGSRVAVALRRARHRPPDLLHAAGIPTLRLPRRADAAGGARGHRASCSSSTCRGSSGRSPPRRLVGAAAIAVAMVVPIPFPKIRRGAPLRPAMIGTAVAVVVAVLVLQFRPSAGTPFFLAAEAASALAAIGILALLRRSARSRCRPRTPDRTRGRHDRRAGRPPRRPPDASARRCSSRPGIKLGGVFHQYLGTPVGERTARGSPGRSRTRSRSNRTSFDVRVPIDPDRAGPLGEARFALPLPDRRRCSTAAVTLSDGHGGPGRSSPPRRPSIPAHAGRRGAAGARLRRGEPIGQYDEVDRSDVPRRRTDQAEVLVLLEDVRGPAGDAARREHRREQVLRDPESV